MNKMDLPEKIKYAITLNIDLAKLTAPNNKICINYSKLSLHYYRV